MECLEDNMNLLSKSCKKAIREYAEAADVAPELNDIFQMSCAPFWDKYCAVSCHHILKYLGSSFLSLKWFWCLVFCADCRIICLMELFSF